MDNRATIAILATATSIMFGCSAAPDDAMSSADQITSPGCTPTVDAGPPPKPDAGPAKPDTGAPKGGGGAFTPSHSTWYCGNACGQNDTGSCGTTYCGSPVTPDVLGAALSLTRMNGPSGKYMGGGLCGKKIEIRAKANGHSIVVPVIDACVACTTDDHVDLTLGVWQALGVDPCLGNFDQEWRFVD